MLENKYNFYKALFNMKSRSQVENLPLPISRVMFEAVQFHETIPESSSMLVRTMATFSSLLERRFEM